MFLFNFYILKQLKIFLLLMLLNNLKKCFLSLMNLGEKEVGITATMQVVKEENLAHLIFALK